MGRDGIDDDSLASVCTTTTKKLTNRSVSVLVCVDRRRLKIDALHQLLADNATVREDTRQKGRGQIIHSSWDDWPPTPPS